MLKNIFYQENNYFDEHFQVLTNNWREMGNLGLAHRGDNRFALKS